MSNVHEAPSPEPDKPSQQLHSLLGARATWILLFCRVSGPWLGRSLVRSSLTALRGAEGRQRAMGGIETWQGSLSQVGSVRLRRVMVCFQAKKEVATFPFPVSALLAA